MGNEVVLITDIVDKYKDLLKNINVNIIVIKEYFLTAENFDKYYENYSVNPRWFELRCFQRWFILLEFLKKNSFGGFLYTDCDVLFFGKVEDEVKKIENYDIGLGSQYGIGIMLGRSQLFLAEYINLLEDCYINKRTLYNAIKCEWREFQDKKIDGGICDMRFFNHLYCTRKDLKILSLSESVINGGIYDRNLSETGGYIKENNIKKISFDGELPYVITTDNDKLFIKTLHCSAVNKPLMKDLISPCLRGL